MFYWREHCHSCRWDTPDLARAAQGVRAGTGGGYGGWERVGYDVEEPQGQHRLRPEAAPNRL